MAAPEPPNTICTPYIGRTIKGWSVRVRICFSVTPAEGSASTLWQDYAGVTDAMATLINALTDATFIPLGIGRFTTTSDYGASGETDNAEDTAVFTFATATGTVAKVSIPAPKDTIFLADNMTVDPANTDVAAFVTALLSGTPETGGAAGFYGATKAGASFSLFLGGLRVRRKTRRKLNIWVRNPELTAPGI